MTVRCHLLAAILLALVVTVAAQAEPVLKFKPVAKMSVGRGGQVVGIVDGKVLHAGGTYWPDDATKIWSGMMDIYDPARDTWEKGPDLPFPMSYGAGDTVNGRLYIVSGSDGKRDFRETIVCARIGGKWQWLWGPPLPAPRLYSVAAVIGSKLYIIAGCEDNAMKGRVYSDIMILDTAHPEEGWKASRAMPGLGNTLPAAAAVGDRIYVFGGYVKNRAGEFENADDAFVYETKRNRWRRLPDLPFATRCSDAITLGGQIYILGGYVTWPALTGREEDFTDKILRFDPASETYTEAGNLLLPVVGISPRLLADGRVFVAGGEDIKKHRTDIAAMGTLE